MDAFVGISREELRLSGFPQPVTITKEVMSSFSDHQRNILQSLANVAVRLRELNEAIEAKRPTSSGVLMVDAGNAVTVCEDDDDWMAITGEERYKREQVRREVIALLGNALDDGMGSLGIIQRSCTNYHVKP